MKIKTTLSTIIVTGMCLMLSFHLRAQSNVDAQLSQINILSPNAASLGKYVDNEVNLHTGTPEISMPIYTVTEGPIKLPISLSYNASGIRVAEQASWVGLGWSLSAGGVIGRTVRSFPDEVKGPDGKSYYGNNGYINYFFDTNITGTGTEQMALTAFARSNRDAEPDLFFFNFGGYSGKFFIREDQTPVVIPFQNIRIKPIFCEDNSGQTCNKLTEPLMGFEVTTPDGIKYYFGKSMDNATYGDPALEITKANTERSGNLSQTVSSWYLYRIESPDGQFAVKLKYAHEDYSYFSLSLGGAQLAPADIEEYRVLVKNNVYGVRLTEIVFSQGSIVFSAGKLREDFGASTGDALSAVQDPNVSARSLSNIQIKSEGQFCKTFDFEYGYFIADSGDPLTGPLKGYESTRGLKADRKRLKLKSVQERSCNSSIVNPKTEFTYFESTPLPSTLSFAVDHWGFYNGKSSNKWLIPSHSTDNGSTFIPGADRDAHWPEMKAGILESVRHPTGGYTQYVYGHDIAANNVAIGGLRIEQINSLDKDGTKLLGKTYEYSGGAILFSIPIYIAKIRNPYIWFASKGWGAANRDGCWVNGISPEASYRYVISSASVHPLRTTLGSHKGYKNVKVIQADNGFSLYTYDVTGASNTDFTPVVAIRSIGINDCSSVDAQYPAVQENVPLQRGVLLKESHFKAIGGEPIKEVTYEPEFKEDEVGAHGMVITTLGIPPQGDPAFNKEFFPFSPYLIKSGKKIKDTKVETTYDPVTHEPHQVKTVTFYESDYHTFPTQVDVYDDVDENASPSRQIKNKYVKDFSPCNTQFPQGAYTVQVNDIESQYQLNLTYAKTESGRITLENNGILNGCDVPDWSLIPTRESAYGVCVYRKYQLDLNTYQKYYISQLISLQESNCLNALSAAVSDPAYKAVHDLNKRNEVAPQLESTMWNLNQVVSGTYVQLKNTDNYIFADQIFQIETTQPLTTTQYHEISVANNVLQKDVSYNPEAEKKYKYAAGRIVEITEKTAPVKSIIWDEANKFPIVKGEGISYADLLTAYTSARNSGSVGSNAFNVALRSNVGRALITTYTFKDLVGVTTMTDPNNLTTTYEYDDLGRVKLARDHKGNIVKHYDYQYDQSR